MDPTADRPPLVNAPNPRRPKAPAPRPAPAPLGRPPFGIPIGRMVTVTMIVSFALTFAVLWTGRHPEIVPNSDDAGPAHPSAPIADAMPRGFAALPIAAPLTKPLLPAVLPTGATRLLAEVQFANAVKSSVVPSE